MITKGELSTVLKQFLPTTCSSVRRALGQMMRFCVCVYINYITRLIVQYIYIYIYKDVIVPFCLILHVFAKLA